MDFPGGSDGKASVYNALRPGCDPWVGKIPWRRKWQPTPVCLPGKSHGQKSLVGYTVHGVARVRQDLATKTPVIYEIWNDRWVDGWMNVLRNRRMGRERKTRQRYRSVGIWMAYDGWANGRWMGGWEVGWIETGKANGWMSGGEERQGDDELIDA